MTDTITQAPTRDVRENGQTILHRTTNPTGAVSGIDTVCGQHIHFGSSHPEEWRGGEPRTITNCEDGCFPATVAEEGTAREVRENADPVIHRTFDGTNAPETICGETVRHRVPDPRTFRGGATAPPLTECPTCFERPTTRRIRPNGNTTVHLTTALDDGTRGPFTTVCGETIQRTSLDVDVWRGEPNPVFTNCTTCFPAPESTPEPTPAAPAYTGPQVGERLRPLRETHLRDLPVGSVLTITSRTRGELRGTTLHFGCKEFSVADLARAGATVQYTANRVGITATCDVTLTPQMRDHLILADQRISLGELNDYAASVVVKELGVTTPANALVMEHGFYGCAAHPGEVIVVGNGRRSTTGPTVPLVGKVTTDSSVLSGIVGQSTGLRSAHFRDCTPVRSNTSAYTMNFATERTFALVPATEEQVSRVSGQSANACATGTLDGDTITACDSDGVQVVREADPF